MNRLLANSARCILLLGLGTSIGLAQSADKAERDKIRERIEAIEPSNRRLDDNSKAAQAASEYQKARALGQSRANLAEPSPESDRYRAGIARRQDELADLRRQRAQHMATLRTQYRSGSDYSAVVKECDAAHEALRLAIEQTLAPLSNDPAYRSAVAKKGDAKARLEQARNTGASASALADAARDALDAANRVAEIESQALRGAPGIAPLRLRVGRAEAAAARLPVATEAFVKADAHYQQLTQAIEDTLADIDAARQDLAYVLSTEPGPADPWPGDEPNTFQRPFVGFDPYADYTGVKCTYEGMWGVKLKGGTYVLDPRQPGRRPLPYGVPYGPLPPR